MKMRNTIFGAMLSATLMLSYTGIASATPLNVGDSQYENLSFCQTDSYDKYGVDSQLVCKMLQVGGSLSFSSDGKSIETSLSDQELIDRYDFTQAQVKDFHAVLSGTYVPPDSQVPTIDDRSTRFYISNDALMGGAFAVLVTAASNSPEALAAAFVGVSSLMAGPVGTAIGAGVTALGATFFINLGLKITGAVAQGKGVVLYLDWGFPPIKAEIE